MFIERITSPGLAHNSYYIADGGEALVCDPRRDVDVYRDLAARRGERLRYVLETHRHEDFAIGSTALAQLGAQVLHAGSQDFGYGEGVADGDHFDLGRLRMTVLQTTGHTRDSLSYALADRTASERPFAVLTGDTLFVGDTGRVDLLGEREAPELAAALYDSVQRLLQLGDGVVLLPAHGSGSVCGAGISHRDLSTLGFERHTRELLSGGQQAFVQAKLAEKHVRPPYFSLMEEWNLQGNAPVLQRLPLPHFMTAGELAERARAGLAVIDVRDPEAFAAGHVPGAYNIWTAGVPSYLGWVVEPGGAVAFVGDDRSSTDELVRMAVRLGYDHLAVLQGGFGAWRKSGRPIGTLGTLDAERLPRGGDAPVLLDVRTPGEWEQGSPEGAVRIFVGELEQRLDELPRDRELVTMCGVGNRAGLAASILARSGFEHVANLLGGYTALQAAR